jgi:hypothetical protein
MNQESGTQQASGESAAQERCICHQFIDLVRDRLGISPAVKQHLMNSRVEFLKAIREVIDERIDHLSAKGRQGTKIAVE